MICLDLGQKIHLAGQQLELTRRACNKTGFDASSAPIEVLSTEEMAALFGASKVIFCSVLSEVTNPDALPIRTDRLDNSGLMLKTLDKLCD